MTSGIHLDDAGLFTMWNETMGTLDGFEDMARRGVQLESAVNFARFVLWSGMCAMFERGSRDDHLKVDGAAVRVRCEALQRKCQEWWSGGLKRDSTDLVEVEALHRKLDVILRQVTAVTTGHALAEPVALVEFTDPRTHRLLTRRELEKQHILAALMEAGWVRAAAARMLGINPRTLYYKCKQFGLEREKVFQGTSDEAVPG